MSTWACASFRETLKYMFLVFSDDDVVPLDRWCVDFYSFNAGQALLRADGLRTGPHGCVVIPPVALWVTDIAISGVRFCQHFWYGVAMQSKLTVGWNLQLLVLKCPSPMYRPPCRKTPPSMTTPLCWQHAQPCARCPAVPTGCSTRKHTRYRC